MSITDRRASAETQRRITQEERNAPPTTNGSIHVPGRISDPTKLSHEEEKLIVRSGDDPDGFAAGG